MLPATIDHSYSHEWGFENIHADKLPLQIAKCLPNLPTLFPSSTEPTTSSGLQQCNPSLCPKDNGNVLKTVPMCLLK